MEFLTIKDLKTDPGWISITYPDGSVRLIYTTMNRDILGLEVLKGQKQDHVYDLAKKRWVRLPAGDLDPRVTITRQRPEIGELDEFANRFV